MAINGATKDQILPACRDSVRYNNLENIELLVAKPALSGL